VPKLVLFAPCEKVLVDEAGLTSLISVAEKIEAKVPKGVPLPRAIPYRLDTVAFWIMEQNEFGQYEEMRELGPKGAPPFVTTAPRVLSGSGLGVKVTAPFDQVPAVDGELEFRLLYRKLGDADWTVAATFPITMVLLPQ
jgi:hypothetical protein